MVHLIQLKRREPQREDSTAPSLIKRDRLAAKTEKLVLRHEVFGRIWLALAVAGCVATVRHHYQARDAANWGAELELHTQHRALATAVCTCANVSAASVGSATCGCDCATQYWNGTGCALVGQGDACTNYDKSTDVKLADTYVFTKQEATPVSDKICGCNRWENYEHYELWLRVLGVVYLFMGIAIVCDDFFEDSLVSLSRVFSLSDDVAGATFMAAGSSAPELFTSTAAVMFDAKMHCTGDKGHANVGVGTIVGSAIFNILVIIGATAMLAGSVQQLDWKPFMRDSGFYAFSIVLLTIVIWDEHVFLYEAIILVLGYVMYIVFMNFNAKLLCIVEEEEAELTVTNMSDSGPIKKQEGADEAGTLPSPKVGNLTPKEQQPMVSDEKPKAEESDDSHNIIDTLGCGCGGYDGFLDYAGVEEDDEDALCSFSIISGLCLGFPSILGKEGWACGNCKAIGVCTKLANTAKVELNVTVLAKFNMYLSVPWYLAYKYTIPCVDDDDTTEEKEKNGQDDEIDAWEYWTCCCIGKYWGTFIFSVLWIGIICYWMVEWCVELGYMLRVSTAVMGLTVLSAGTSVPDALASIGVAKKGQANMAVSNALGSNVFDVLLGLGLPYMLKNIKSMMNGAKIDVCDMSDGAVNMGVVPVCMCTKDVIVYVFCLFIVLMLTLAIFVTSKFKLHPGVGIWMLLLYVVFAGGAILRDQDAFGPNWLGERCKD